MIASSLISRAQPTRPDHRFREFIPLRGARGKEFDEDVLIRLFILCAKCKALEDLLCELSKRLDNDYRRSTEEDEEEFAKEDLTVGHYESASQLRDSVKDGCHLCTLIWNSLAVGEADSADWDDEKHGGVTLRMSLKGPRKYRTRLNIRTDLAGSYGGALYVTPPQGYTLPPLTMSMATVSTRSATCASFYKRCLDICDKKHTRCHARKAERLPTRLLRVNGTGTAPCIQLVSPGDEGLEFPNNTNFAALSYCWGEQRGFRLLKSNYQSLKVDIPFDYLPGTIQDAIVITTELGLQYLWVDALCIVQDSPEDWSREAAKMCHVYQGCSIALMASAASNSGEGLFAVRDPLLQAPCLLGGTMVAQSAAETKWQSDFPWVLETRGWAIQEHLLPTRSIKFASYLIWECKELSINEFGLESQLDTDNLQREFTLLVLDPEATGPVDITRIRNLWWLILKKYKKSKLSVKTDRLAAIAGLSSAIQRRTGWTYIYGLWQPFIIQELLWYRVWESRGSNGLRPSWSWASCDGVQFITDEDHIGSTKVAEYVGTLPSMSGQAQSLSPAVIELSGVLFRTHKVGNLQVLRVEGWPDSSYNNTIYDQLGRSWKEGDMLLPLSVWDERRVVKGLVVVPTMSSTTFERVGYFHTSVVPWKLRNEDMECLLTCLKGSGEEPFTRQKILLM